MDTSKRSMAFRRRGSNRWLVAGLLSFSTAASSALLGPTSPLGVRPPKCWRKGKVGPIRARGVVGVAYLLVGLWPDR